MLSHIHVKARSVLASLALISGLVLSSSANAGWALIANADNPSPMDGSPSSAGDAEVLSWLNTLINPDLPVGSSYVGGNVSGVTGTTAFDVGAGIDPQYLVLHFGGPQQTGDAFWAFSCVVNSVSCSQFTLNSINYGVEETYPPYGLSFYRVYGATTGVPEPATLGLFGLGLLGVGLARRSKKV